MTRGTRVSLQFRFFIRKQMSADGAQQVGMQQFRTGQSCVMYRIGQFCVHHVNVVGAQLSHILQIVSKKKEKKHLKNQK